MCLRNNTLYSRIIICFSVEQANISSVFINNFSGSQFLLLTTPQLKSLSRYYDKYLRLNKHILARISRRKFLLYTCYESLNNLNPRPSLGELGSILDLMSKFSFENMKAKQLVKLSLSLMRTSPVLTAWLLNLSSNR